MWQCSFSSIFLPNIGIDELIRKYAAKNSTSTRFRTFVMKTQRGPLFGYLPWRTLSIQQRIFYYCSGLTILYHRNFSCIWKNVVLKYNRMNQKNFFEFNGLREGSWKKGENLLQKFLRNLFKQIFPVDISKFLSSSGEIIPEYQWKVFEGCVFD